jgi:WD40 repeat protein
MDPVHIVVTAHGIRTFGAWQKRLKSLLETAEPGIIVLNYNFGFFSIFAFLFPPLRWLATRKFRHELKGIPQSYGNARVDLVGHSFGTHLIGWGITRLPASERPRIDTVILAASVLRPGFQWGDLMRTGAVKTLLNECGTHDVVLLVNQLVVLFTGVAGILGFKGLTGDHFRNDWHRFQHSDYFRRRGADYDGFMATRWVPLLTRGVMPPHVDARPTTMGYGIWVFLLQNLEFAKLIAYAGCALLAIGWYGDLAAERAADLARRFAAQSQTVGVKGWRLPESLALAIRSVRTADTDEGRTALRRAVALFPAVESTVQYPGAPSLVSFSPVDNLLASVWDGRSVHIRDVAEHRDTQSFTLDAPVQAMKWSSQRGEYRLFLYTEDGTFWSASAAGLTNVHTAAPRAHAAAIGETDGRPVLGLVLDGFRVQFRTVTPDGVQAEVGHDQPISVTFRADGRVAATSGYDGRVKMWPVGTSMPRAEALQHDEPVSVVAFAPDDRRVAFADNFGGIVVRELPSSRDQFRVRLDDAVSALAFSPDGRWLASGGGDRTARVWDCITGRELARMADEGGIADLAFSHDGDWVAVAGQNAVRIWSFPTHLPIDLPGIVTAIAVGDGGEDVFAADSYGNIDVVTLRPRPSVRHLREASGQEAAVRALAVHGNAVTAAFDDGTIRTWRDEAPVDSRSSAARLATTMALTPDGGVLAAGDWDGSVQVLMADGSVAVPADRFHYEHAIDALAFVGPRQRLAVASMGVVEMWDWQARPAVVVSRARAAGSVLAFSSDGSLFLTGDATGARAWSWESGALIGRIETYGELTAAAFSRDDEYVVVGSGNRTARRAIVTPLSPSALIREGCARLRMYHQRAPAECP